MNTEEYMIEKTGYMDVEVLVDEFLKVKQESKDEISRLEKENEILQSKLQELNLQYISDFGQLQEKELIPDVELPVALSTMLQRRQNITLCV